MTRTPTRTTRTPTPTTPTTPTTPSAPALGRCVEPVSVERFRSAFWEQKPLVVRRGEAGRFDDLLSAADVERLVCSSALRHPGFRLVKEGAQLHVSDYTEDVPWRPSAFTETAKVERVLAEFEAGATIVLQGLHHNWAPLARFCRELEAELAHPAQANAYYTPRCSQGLPVHHDTHNVFVLQVSGQKRWLVYDPVLTLPLRDQRYAKELGVPGEPAEDTTLDPGDTLYLPRGWLHEALTSDTDSLHITVGVNVYTWLDAFKAALADCADELEFRRGAPDDGEGAGELLELLAARLEPAQVVARRRHKLVRSRRPVLQGQLTQLRALDRLEADTPVERRPTVIAELAVSEQGRARLAFEGKTLTFPPQAREEVEHLAAAHGPSRIGDLPGRLDEAGRLVLVRRLVREGFLRISGLDNDGPAGVPRQSR